MGRNENNIYVEQTIKQNRIFMKYYFFVVGRAKYEFLKFTCHYSSFVSSAHRHRVNKSRADDIVAGSAFSSSF